MKRFLVIALTLLGLTYGEAQVSYPPLNVGKLRVYGREFVDSALIVKPRSAYLDTAGSIGLNNDTLKIRGASGRFNVSLGQPVVGQILVYQSDSVWKPGYASGLGLGTVTSVGLALPTDVFIVTNSPVTHFGTLTGAFRSQTRYKFFAAPDTGDGVPYFRYIGINDLPFGKFTWSLAGGSATYDSLRFVPGSRMTIQQSGNALTFTGPDSVTSAHKADTLVNIYQTPWFRNADGSVRLTYNTDSVVIGQTTFNRYFNAKTEIAVKDNGKWGLAFVGDSGSSINIPIMAGRLNNANYWQLKHYGTLDRLRLETFNSGVTANYWELSNTGFSINGAPLDVATIYGNTSIGNFNSAMTGGSHLRVKGFIYGNYQSGEINDQSNNVFQNTNATQDLVDYESTTTTDSSTGGHDKSAQRNLLFTSSSAQSMFTCTISQLVTYTFEVTLVENPSGVDSGYFAKKIFVTCRNKAGTIYFDSTTAFTHKSSTSSTLSTADLVVSASGNTLTFSAKGSATQQVRAEMYIRRMFIK